MTPFFKSSSGQSLVEFALVTPIILLMLIAAGYLGIGLYQANMASDAVRQPAMKKLEMAADSGAISNERLLGYVNDGPLKGTIRMGPPVDDVSITELNDDVSVIVGSKQFKIMGGFLPTFEFTAAQAINRNILRSASNGARVRPLHQSWLPFGNPRVPPWEHYNKNLPMSFDLIGGCKADSVSKGSTNALAQLILPNQTYIARQYLDVPSPVTENTLLQIANTYDGDCKDNAAAQAYCEGEYQDLLPQKLPAQYTGNSGPPAPLTAIEQFRNPPGGPAFKMIYRVVCSGGDCKAQDPKYEKLPEIGPTHGIYWDPSGKFEKPPADFVQSCVAHQQALCQMNKAIQRANEILGNYPEECKGF